MMTDCTPLSPAAEAIADAFEKAWRLSGADPFECCIQPLGAVLRAAALVCKRDSAILLSLADELESAE